MMFPFASRSHSRGPVNHSRRRTRLVIERLDDRCLLSAGYQQLNLVGYQPGMARLTDPNLNGWGLDFAPKGPFCVADTSTGVATFYDQQGKTVATPVTIPAAAIDPPGTPGSPTGVVYNPTSNFVISENGKSVTAQAADPDTLVASAKAYLGALNKLMVKRQRTKPEAMVAP